MTQERLLHVLLIYRTMIPSVRLCGHCQMEELSRQGHLEYRAQKGIKLRRTDLNWADIVLLGRLDNWYEYRLTKMLKEAGKYVIYIIDDDLLNIPPEISSAAHYQREDVKKHIRGMIELSDAILSPSPILLEKYAVDDRRALIIEEPAIDPVPYKPHDPDKPVKIGFAGSIDRVGDVENILGDALKRIKCKYEDKVEFEFFGAIPSFADEIDAKTIPYCDGYDAYRKRLNELEWDIGLAPMPDTPFHACKHYNKFVEYSAAGIATIFSNKYPYIRLMNMGAPGLFCENDSFAWYEALEQLITNSEKREQLRKEAILYAKNKMSISICSKDLFDQGFSKVSRKNQNNIASIALLEVVGLLCILFGKARNFISRFLRATILRWLSRGK